MKLRITCLTAGLLFALAGVAQAQTSCGTNDFELASDASVTQGIMASPAKYEGFIITGTLSPGTWDIQIDDTGWPAGGSARRSHLMSMYTYDAGSGTFSMTLPMLKVQIMLAGPDQTFDGVASVTFTATDSNGNGSFNNNEFNGDQTVTMSVDATCAGTGTALCGGMGAANGSADPNLVNTPLAGALQTDPCVTAVSESLWGDVKKRFRD